MPEINKHMYLFLTKFEVYTVSYKPIISPLIYGPRVKNVGHKLKVKNQRSVIHSTDHEDMGGKILLYLCCV